MTFANWPYRVGGPLALYAKEKMGGGRIRWWQITIDDHMMQSYLFSQRLDSRRLHAMLFFFCLLAGDDLSDLWNPQ